MRPESERIAQAIDILEGGRVDGAHHKMWVIDQALRALTGALENDTDEYLAIVGIPIAEGESYFFGVGERSEDADYGYYGYQGGYEWDCGIAP